MPTSQRAIATSHRGAVCCGCGAETDLLQWVEGHRFCLECSSALDQEVWARFQHGIEPRPGADGPAHSALLDILEARPWLCEQLPEVDQCLVPPMRLMLVAGFHSHDQQADELTVDPAYARLFPFSAAGCRSGFAAARRWTDVLSRDAHVAPFVARVLVTGDPDAPDSVVWVWRFERGDSSRARRYPFDD